MNKNAIITFDYELFLGKNVGTIDESIINPTSIILEILRINHARAIFFVDAAWLLFIKNINQNDYQKVIKQLKQITNQNSSIELHLHPQWINAYIKDGIIGFDDNAHYKLHSLHFDKIHDLFRDSIDLLNEITGESIMCFRAGGFCIEPFEPLLPIFDKFNIKYDFSVVPGLYLQNNKSYDFDFSNMLISTPYRFNANIKTPLKDGKFIEIPLSTYNNNPIYRIFNNIALKLYRDKIYGDGKGIQTEISFISRFISKNLGFSRGFLSLDRTSLFMLKYLLRVHFHKYPLIVLLSHPKLFSKEAISNLSYVTKNYNTLNTNDLSMINSFINEKI